MVPDMVGLTYFSDDTCLQTQRLLMRQFCTLLSICSVLAVAVPTIRRRRAFERLFEYRPRDEAGSLAYRWEMILKRLESTDPVALARAIRLHAIPPEARKA